MGVREAVAKAMAEVLGGIRAYHGSPHDFTAFDAAKIGTGEGAQAYGHGLYFAGNEGVARGYRDALKYKGMNWDDPDVLASYWSHQFGGDRAQAITQLENSLKARSQMNPGNPAVLDAISLLEKDAPFSTVVPKGHMYEVNINADPAQMLDWDKPLHQQPAPVQAIAQDVLRNPGRGLGFVAEPRGPSTPISGGNIYNALAHYGERDLPGATAAFQEAGVPGIKYLDAGSRGNTQSRAIAEQQLGLFKPGTPEFEHWTNRLAEINRDPVSSNYVVFDPANIDILKKYGIAGAAAAPVVGAAMGSTYDQGTYQEPDPMQGTYQ
jgi:hypothetical protein